MRRSNPTDNGALLLLKNQSGVLENNANDRLAFLKFDLSVLTQTINQGTVRLQTPRGVATSQPTNTFDAGETVYLYGIPDGAAEETADLLAVTWANSNYLTGTGTEVGARPMSDTTGNSINDSLATLIGSYTWPVQSNAGDVVDFFGPALNSFLQADTNDIATFIITISISNATKTPVFGSSSAATPRPTLLTNGDAIPEPATCGMAIVLAAATSLIRPRRA